MRVFLNMDDTNNNTYCVIMLEDVDEVLKTMQIEENSLIDDEIQPIKTFESATDFKGFEALHNIVLDIDDQSLCFDVQTKLYKLYCDICLRYFNEMLTN